MKLEIKKKLPKPKVKKRIMSRRPRPNDDPNWIFSFVPPSDEEYEACLARIAAKKDCPQ